MTRYLTIAMLAAAIAMPAHSQTTTRLTASKANEYGLIYSLPTTALDIYIETERTELTPGEFYNYARRNLDISNAITQPSQSATVKSVTIVPRGVANPQQRWLMQFKGGQEVYVSLNDADVPLAINTDAVAPMAQPDLPVAKAAEPTPLETPAARQAVTQEMTMSSSTSKRAQLASERIFELREQRNDLISGNADNTPPDGRAMQLALDNLAAQEAALTAMFTGTEKKWTEVTKLTYVPDSASTDVTNHVIARISATDGIVAADDLTGAPIYITVSTIQEGKIPLDEKGNEKPFPKNGVAYRIPGTVLVTVDYNGKQMTLQQVELAQCGVVYGLDPKLFTDKKNPAYVVFNPTTGSIVTLATKVN